MALPGQGNSLSLSQIGQELGQQESNLSLRNLSSVAGLSEPDAISEFYGYSHGGGGGDFDYVIYLPGIYIGSPCEGKYGDLYTHVNDGDYFILDVDGIPEKFEGIIYELLGGEKGSFNYNIYQVKRGNIYYYGGDKSPCGPY